LKFSSRFSVSAISAGAQIALVGLVAGVAHPTQAALVDGRRAPELVIGLDDDKQENALIQAGAVANHSLNRTDVLDGGPGNHVRFGLNDSDVIDGGPGYDIIDGGPDGVEQVFCTSQSGASIAFADLTVPSPAFAVVSLPEVQTLNPLVGAMIR
jgi:hypothetical protein